MLQILNWDFRSNTSDTKLNVNVFSAGVRQDGDSLKKSEYHVVQVMSWFAYLTMHMNLIELNVTHYILVTIAH